MGDEGMSTFLRPKARWEQGHRQMDSWQLYLLHAGLEPSAARGPLVQGCSNVLNSHSKTALQEDPEGQPQM